jgi:hypothetical protein
MEIKKIEKASKYLEQIKKLDVEIISIDKMAVFISSNKSEIMLSISVNDLEKNNEKDSILDEDGSLKKNDHSTDGLYARFFTFSIGGSGSQVELKTGHEFKETIQDTTTLEILAVLLFRKNIERESLINKIKNL